MTDQLERARESYAECAWTEAYELLTGADRTTPLSAEDLELLATAAHMLGRHEEYVSGLERAHHAYVERTEWPRAVRCAFWISINLIIRGEVGRATGWLGRARRLAERVEGDCPERGYLLLALTFDLEAAGDYEAAIASAAEAAATGERFGDHDLFALAAQDQGIFLIRQGRVAEGVRLLDEAMVAVTAGELSPIVNGFVYCGVIMGCQAAYDPRRATEWTEALARWCESQPDLVSFTGTCLVHRAEIMQMRGAWPRALEEALHAGERCEQSSNRSGAAEALYRQGEIHRLQGEFAAAEEAYREARRAGFQPQPGLALLRLATGQGGPAAAAIGRALAEASEPSRRAELLPAQVEVALDRGDVQSARSACEELEEIARRWKSDMLGAMAAYSRGAVELADGNAQEALVALRRAEQTWRELEAPYEAARATLLVGLACRALHDEETAALELEAARDTFAGLGAAPDVARVEARLRDGAPGDLHGLTARELQVLRLVAAGRSNREIAEELVISEHTVARHMQNIFAKLGVSSRTRASAFAYAHDLV